MFWLTAGRSEEPEGSHDVTSVGITVPSDVGTKNRGRQIHRPLPLARGPSDLRTGVHPQSRTPFDIGHLGFHGIQAAAIGRWAISRGGRIGWFGGLCWRSGVRRLNSVKGPVGSNFLANSLFLHLHFVFCMQLVTQSRYFAFVWCHTSIYCVRHTCAVSLTSRMCMKDLVL